MAQLASFSNSLSWAAFLVFGLWSFAVPPSDQDWMADTILTDSVRVTDSSIGDAQGAVLHNQFLYVYSDLSDSNPRRGLIKEYTLEIQPTGRKIELTDAGTVLSIHPTGLSFHPKLGTLLSDTWQKRGMIYKIDWEKALNQGNLDGAVQATIVDDVAINGSRCVFVKVKNQDYIASADYGDVNPQLRIYQPEKLLKSTRTSEKGVLVQSLKVGAFNQNIHWDSKTGTLTLVQNVIVGLGWRLEHLNLARAMEVGSAHSQGGRKGIETHLSHDELEGWLKFDDGRELFVTSSRTDNLNWGLSRTIESRITPRGALDVGEEATTLRRKVDLNCPLDKVLNQ